MAKKDDKSAISVVAELEIVSSLGTERIRSFDKAWTVFRAAPVPTTCRLIGFVRKTDEELAKG